MTQRTARSARSSITEAALEMVGEAELDDLVRVLTPERLANVGDWAPSTVRYHFGGRSIDGGPRDLGFRRRELAVEVVRLAVERAERATLEAVERWDDALAEPEGSGDVTTLVAVMNENLARFVPGGSAEDSGSRDRAYYLALAVADDDPEIARLLRDSRARQIQAWAPALVTYVRATGRRLRPGRSAEELAAALYAVVDGQLVRLRTEPASAPSWFADLLLTVIDAFTEPGASPAS